MTKNFKGKNKITRVSNAIILTICLLALISVVSLLTGNYESTEGYTRELYLYNLVIMLSCTVVSIILLFVLNTKIDLYKDEYTTSRKLFNLFIVFSILSMSMMVAMPIAEYFIYKEFHLYNILYIVLGYIPAYVCGYILVNKKEMLNGNNSKKINVTNFFVIYLIMSYYINIITDLIGLIYKLEETKKILIDMGISVLWVVVVLVAYRMINREESSKNIENLKEIKEAKIIEKESIEELPKKITKKNSSKPKKSVTKKKSSKSKKSAIKNNTKHSK